MNHEEDLFWFYRQIHQPTSSTHEPRIPAEIGANDVAGILNITSNYNYSLAIFNKNVFREGAYTQHTQSNTGFFIHGYFFIHLYFFQIACFLLDLYQDQNKDGGIILNRFFMSECFKCKINTNMQFLHQTICKVFKNNCLSSSDMWFFKLQLFKKQTLHIFMISHVNSGSQEKMPNRWSICSPERSRSTDWSLLVMVRRVRIAKESKVGNAWKIKYFQLTRRKVNFGERINFTSESLFQNGLWFYLNPVNSHVCKSVVAVAIKHTILLVKGHCKNVFRNNSHSGK